MMTEAKQTSEIPFRRKLVIPMIAGGLAGFVSSFAITFNMDGWLGDAASISRQIAAVVGGLYMVIAIGVGVGAASRSISTPMTPMRSARCAQCCLIRVRQWHCGVGR